MGLPSALYEHPPEGYEVNWKCRVCHTLPEAQEYEAALKENGVLESRVDTWKETKQFTVLWVEPEKPYRKKGEKAEVSYADPEVWEATAVGSLTEAQNVLDALERIGCRDRELIVLGNSSFVVRWKQGPEQAEGPAAQRHTDTRGRNG